jgi:XTP/dITP diphosphohydrolase
MRALLIATTNQHKLEEFRVLFRDLPYQLSSLHDLHSDLDVEETGTTFQENADLKALTYARTFGMLALADDSGIEIDALDGAPGVYSARFMGVQTPYEERFRFILAKMQGLTDEQRSARFRCVITIAEPDGYHQSVDGTIEGRITDKPLGEHGFGYDPIFYVPQYGQTTAEMPPDLKNRISHRGIAAQKARVLLENWPTVERSR